MKVGRRLAIKMLNASKFALGARRAAAAPITARGRPRDAAQPRARSSTRRPTAFEGYDYARVLQRTETFFWRFCDDYLELVKGRRYGEQGADGAGSANAALTAALSVAAAAVRAVPAVRHRRSLVVVAGGVDSSAPRGRRRDELDVAARRRPAATAQADQQTYDWATDVLFEVRKQRSEAKQPLKVPITKVTVDGRAPTPSR